MEGIETGDSSNFLRKHSYEGYVGFNVKAKDTDENKNIHSSFRDFANKECEGNYTLALKQLLSLIESDYKYQSLFELILDMQDRIDVLELKLNEKKTKKDEVKDNGTF